MPVFFFCEEVRIRRILIAKQQGYWAPIIKIAVLIMGEVFILLMCHPMHPLGALGALYNTVYLQQIFYLFFIYKQPLKLQILMQHFIY